MTIFQDMGILCMVEGRGERVSGKLFRQDRVRSRCYGRRQWRAIQSEEIIVRVRDILENTSGDEVQDSGEGLALEIGK